MKTLAQRQDLAVKTLGKGRQYMHTILIETLQHIHKHGDRNALTNLMDKLKESKADSGNRHRIQVWLTDLAGMVFDDNKESKTYGDIIDWKGKQHIQDHFEKAKKSPWFEYRKPASVKEIKPAPVFAGFNLEAKLSEVINAAKSMRDLEPQMTEENKAKINLSCSLETINLLLDLIGIEAVLNDDLLEDSQVAANG